MENSFVRPNFFGIGAQKCASSWLYDILCEHPEVVVSQKKEIDFFSYHYERGYLWYESQFERKSGAIAIGENSPSYFNEASVPERVYAYAPNAKILVSLRDPVERALSQHRHLVRIGYVNGPDYSFETGLKNNPSYIEQGLYASHLRRWRQYFGDDRILVVLMDDIKCNAREVAERVYDFLGVNKGFIPESLGKRSNESYVPRNRMLYRIVQKTHGKLEQLGFDVIWKFAADIGLRKIYRRYNRVSSAEVIPPVREETLMHLRDVFEPDIRELESMLGRTLANWIK